MAFLPSSSSSSITYAFTYDVFISFRGSDTRYDFTGNLYKALYGKGIHTFIDDKELHKGDEITPSLEKAIQKSRIFIIVLSKDYASSSFCLDELSKILDCSQEEGRLVWPVFYDVDPSDVRKLKGTFGEAMILHTERFKDNKDKLQKWTTALQQVANLSGWHFKHGDGYEHEFIGKIVNEVSRKINRVALPPADYPVGLESQVRQVVSLLDVGSIDRVHMVGIHGTGGIGKTTLALAVYNSIADHFEGLCFLENVRENSNKHGLLHLQKTLLLAFLGEKEIEITSVKHGSSIIQHRLQQKKVLLILDDVDKKEQLNDIIGRPNWVGPGSRVIITTRNQQLLACHGVEITYKVEELTKEDATKLFTWNAFKNQEVNSSYEDLLNQALSCASGLPLALEVIGSNLFGKTREEWESALEQYRRIPPKEIQKILQVSFDALEEEEKNIFLDIACCFKGYELGVVKDILCAHYGFCIANHIKVLVQKSLITITPYLSELTLHDLIEDMGKEIVRQESPQEPGNRSRLWFHEDIFQVLEQNTETSRIEMIHLDYPSSEKVGWDGEAFKKMKKLKTLIIRKSHFSNSSKHLPNSIRVLVWWKYPLADLPSDFHPKKLSICKLPECIKECRFLRKLTLFGCQQLREICEGILPRLTYLLVIKCPSLSSSCRSMLMRQDLHEDAKIDLGLRNLEGETIPERFEHQNRGRSPSLSFWFRNDFPDILLCIASPPEPNMPDHDYSFRVNSFNNGTLVENFRVNWGYTLLQRLIKDYFDTHMSERCRISKNEWNHVEFRTERGFDFGIGIHVLKEQNMQDIRFTNPLDLNLAPLEEDEVSKNLTSLHGKI